jgi:Apea-like HEPN
MNRYQIDGKLQLRDAIEVGNLTAILVTNPRPFTGTLPLGAAPEPSTSLDSEEQPLVHLDYDDPTPETPHAPPKEPIPFKLEFDAPDIDIALEWGSEEIEARADILAFLTFNHVEVQTLSCVEITPGKYEGLQSVHEGSVHPEPVVLNNEYFTSVMNGTALEQRLSPKLLGSFRWFRKGLGAKLPEDEFLYYWIALEMIATEFSIGKPRFMLCPRCQTNFKECPNCKRSTRMEPQASQGIIALFQKHLNWPKTRFRQLNTIRAKLMHGNKAVSEAFRKELMQGNGVLRTALVAGYEVLLGFKPGSHRFMDRLFFYSDPSPQLRLEFSRPPNDPENELGNKKG